TNADLDAPAAMSWSQPQLAAAIATSDAAIVGFAAEPAYVLRTLEDMLTVIGAPPAAVIDFQPEGEFAARSPRLAAALGVGEPGSPYVEGSAPGGLRAVARGCYAARVRRVLAEAERRADQLTQPPLVLDPSAV